MFAASGRTVQESVVVSLGGDMSHYLIAMSTASEVLDAAWSLRFIVGAIVFFITVAAVLEHGQHR